MAATEKISPNPLTEEDRLKFEVYTRKWQDLLNLGRWRIALSAKHASKDSMAEAAFDEDSSNRLVRIKLGKTFGTAPVNEETLEMTALHEVLHVFLKDFKDVCTTKPHEQDAQMWHEHEIVHVLEKLLYELGKEIT